MSLILFLAQLVIGFLTRKIFLDYLGAEVLGLNTTLGNILGFLNLAELGIGMAMATSLYKPLHDGDHETVCEIISVQGLLYKRIAFFLAVAGLLVMFFFPVFYKNIDCGLFYAYVAFVVFLFGSLNSYLWNYRVTLISADQKNFKITPWIQGVRYIKIGFQVFTLVVIHWGIWGWILWEFVNNIVVVFVVNYVLKREYPWLHKASVSSTELLKKYKHLLTKTKQLFVHKLSAFVLYQTPPLIISMFVSLSMVTYYGNYMLIIGYISSLLNTIFSSMGASIGNLIAEKNSQHTLNVFWELLTSRIWFVGVACFGVYLFMEPLITWWLGSQYILPDKTFVLILIGAFVSLSRSIVDSFKDAFQLFGDVGAPVAEAVINLGASLYLGYLWGLNGILLGSNLSLIIIVLLWKPYYLFRYGLKRSCWGYYLQYALLLFILLFCAFVSQIVSFSTEHTDYIMTLLYKVPSFMVFAVLSYLLFSLTMSGMRRFSHRIIKILIHKT
jgi:hypothetical protein